MGTLSPRSNIGGVTINDVALDFWHSGQNREDIGMEDLEHRLRAETMESQGASLTFVSFVLLSVSCVRKLDFSSNNPPLQAASLRVT